MTHWSAAPAALPSLERNVHVWSVRLDDQRVDLTGKRDLLSPDERERSTRFHFEQHRRRYLVAHIALHEILASYLEMEPGHIFFELGANGKPKLPLELATSGVQFNLSHSHDMALIAVGCMGELGVDIEFVKPEFQFHEIAKRFFTTKEVAALLGLPSHLQRQAFFKCWTSKEAILKAKGTGLSGKLDEVNITIGAANQVLIEANVAGWSLTEIIADGDYEAALVTAGRPSALHCYSWQTLIST
jgi:4'-phosphopantetheinyl transferase